MIKRVLTFPALVLWRTFFWTYDRATVQYDILVIVILAFIWLTPPGWLNDPNAPSGEGLVGWVLKHLR